MLDNSATGRLISGAEQQEAQAFAVNIIKESLARDTVHQNKEDERHEARQKIFSAVGRLCSTQNAPQYLRDAVDEFLAI